MAESPYAESAYAESPYDLAAFAARPLPAPLTSVRYVPETGSTNADLLRDLAGATGEVLVTDHQTAGRGRLDRRWEEPTGTSLMLSVRLRPEFPVLARGWLPLLAGLALADAIEAVAPTAGVELKWPNDVLLGPAGRKVAGVLAEAAGDVVVIGMGCNVSQHDGQLPVATATSLALAGAADVDRTELLFDVLTRLAGGYRSLAAAAGDAEAAGLAAAYRARSGTVGRDVTITRPADVLVGRAVRIAGNAGLVVDTGDGEVTVLAGDVTHVRAAG